MDLNKVMFIGNIVNDPQMRTTSGGQNVTSFRIATNRRWKNQNTGEMQEDAQFHNIIAWGKLAEICSQYMTKGMRVFIEGRLTHRSWDDQQGQKRYMTEVVAENAIMLDRKGSGQNTNTTSQAAPAAAATAAAASGPKQDDVSIPSPEQIPTINVDDDQEEIKVEDIPF